RSLFGTNAALQVAVAAALLIGVNVYSFQHYVRQDWTREPKKFTLPETVRDDLSQLRGTGGKTTIVVYKQHKAFGALSETVDAYETAAEDKVVEKVNDLVEQFRELGPQFEVVVLDVKEKADYDREKEKAAEGDQDEPPVTPVNEYREKRKGYYEK